MKHPSTPSEEGERLSKRIARMVSCSRREAEQYIADGWVRVDGTTVEQPQYRVTDQARVELDTNATLIAPLPVTLVWHKPANAALQSTALSLASHCPTDPSHVAVVQRHFRALECPVSLEEAASGLVAWTQDWRVARKLTEDMAEMEHELLIDVQGLADESHLLAITRAMNDPRHNLPHAKLSIGSARPERSRLRLAVKGFHPGLAAYLCDLAQLRILAVHRSRLGRVGLGDVKAGQWRYLSPHERF
jgi:23S rRNA pseudouridine2604 synthase